MARKSKKTIAEPKPPKGCPVNDIPNEILAHIFYVGTFYKDKDDKEKFEDEDDDEIPEKDSRKGKWSKTVGPLIRTVTSDQVQSAAKRSSHSNRSDDSDGELSIVVDIDVDGLPNLPFQVLASHVCKHWREVAIESPELWNRITFSEGAPFLKSIAWIERSKGQPLHLEIDCTLQKVSENKPGFESIVSLNDFYKILDTIIPHVQRWCSLALMVDQYTYMYPFLAKIASCESAPLLKLLQLYHYDDGEERVEFEPQHLIKAFIPFSNNAPNLVDVALWGVHIAWDDTTILTGLRELELAYHTSDVRPSWDSFTRMLRESKELETLTLCLSGPSGSSIDWPVDDTIEVPSLKNLILSYNPPEYICPLLKHFEFPNMTALVLDFEDADYTLLVQQLATSSPRRTKPIFAALDNLKLSGLPCSRKAIHEMYSQLANLKSLHLKLDFLDQDFFSYLQDPKPSTASSVQTPSFYCPSLEAITTSGIAGSEMRKLLNMRKAAGIPIKKVFMSELDELEDEDQEWIVDNTESFELFEPSDSEDDDFDNPIGEDDEDEDEEDEDGGSDGSLMDVD